MNKVMFLLATVIIISCDSNHDGNRSDQLFELLPSAHTGIEFTNHIIENQTVNYFKFIQLYMGAGVGVGDINNDGLEDIYFNSNFGQSKLYLNKGNLQFEDITDNAGLTLGEGFRTGVSMVDINQDGFIDIYICRSGWYKDKFIKKNLLYINNGDLTFTESAEEFGLDDSSNSVQSSFFDYDKDGDLDMFLINTTTDFTFTKQMLKLDFVYSDTIFSRLGSYDKLYQNNGDDTFTDVSTEAGILPDIAFGLSVITTDFNNDNWPDIFVGNDFISPDYLYINQGDGTFVESAKEYMKHTSFYSMGADVADVNSDGLSDLMVLDMMPQDYRRSKTSMSMTDQQTFYKAVEWGYNYQYMHNMLHINSGFNSFVEVAQMAGVDKSDWSWSVLIDDLDNDGLEDIYVTNGIKKMVTNQDFEQKVFDKYKGEKRQILINELLDELPSGLSSNVAYRAQEELDYEDYSQTWGLDSLSISTGCIIADLDNDGDLDIVTNESDRPAMIYQNHSNRSTNHYLRVELDANSADLLNTQIILRDSNNDIISSSEVITTRGYLSSQSRISHFGLGEATIVPKVEVQWPDGTTSLLSDIGVDQTIVVSKNDAQHDVVLPLKKNEFFKKCEGDDIGLAYAHSEDKFDSYKEQVLLPHGQSNWGPALAVGDMNGDGLDDTFIGGARGQSAQLFIQDNSGKFSSKFTQILSKDDEYEDVNAQFIDYDNDGDLDLYVVSGGSHYKSPSAYYNDRIYINNRGTFDSKVMLNTQFPGSVAAFQDMNEDGYLDVFRGSRNVPNRYPESPVSYILHYDDGQLSLQNDIIPDGGEIGMVTDAQWADVSGDDRKELVIAGEWMTIEVLSLDKTLEYITQSLGLSDHQGWWNTISITDIDDDGDNDIIGGNLGLNYKFHASKEQPFRIHAADYDDNGTVDIFLAKELDDSYVPIRGRTCSSMQMPSIKEKYATFAAFSEADINDILGVSNIATGLTYDVQNFESTLFVKENETFQANALPRLAQTFPTMSIVIEDLNGDSLVDLIIGGNMYDVEVETTRSDAGTGLILLQKSDHSFVPVESKLSNLVLSNDVRAIKMIDVSDKRVLLVGNNNSSLEAFEKLDSQ